MTEQHEKSEEAGTRGAPVTVFVSDPSAEAEQIAQALRAAGYVVVDVPLSMLVARVAVQRPRVILIDADAEGAIDSIARVHELSDDGEIDVVFFGKGGDPSADDALAREGSGFFARPVDIPALLKKVELLTGGPSHPEPRHTTPPPSLPSSRAPASSSVPHSLPPPSMRLPELRPVPRNTPAPRGSVPTLGASPMELAPGSLRRPSNVQAPLSGELEALLAEAEQRVGGQLGHESMLPSPEEEIEAVLPADVLASLDEPIDDDEDDAVPDPALGAMHRGNTTGAGQPRGTTGADTGAGTPPNPRAASSRPNAVELPSAPPPKTSGGTNAGSTGASTTGTSLRTQMRVGTYADVPVQQLSPAPPPVRSIPSPIPAPLIAPIVRIAANDPPPSIVSVLGPADAPRALAVAIAARQSGVLAFESSAGVRRVVLREGDVVTSASSLDEESLLPFLAARGELPRDRVTQLAGKVPPSGRHAGAALVAHGYMRQDQLWNVLRAHAEWVLARVVAQEEGTAGFEAEADAPARLRGEPSVFGAATGAEVFVEVVRRVVAPAEATARLGGEASRIAAGQNERLVAECALGAVETEWLAGVHGQTLGDALATAGDPDFAAVLYALTLLGVCEAIPAIGAPALRVAAPPPSAPDLLDDEAIRARVRARLQLVDEGDYFAVLGVSRDATSYEVKRAFLELRRAFEPSRLLTPALADLVSDVRKIASVLDEAYEILRDTARRDRYRRAIDATPR